jgi:hypothetical protein
MRGRKMEETFSVAVDPRNEVAMAGLEKTQVGAFDSKGGKRYVVLIRVLVVSSYLIEYLLGFHRLMCCDGEKLRC